MEIKTILWREWIYFKREIFNITTSAIITPILYMIAFGWGLGSEVQVEGSSYMHFVIPGIIALTTMNTSFSAISTRLNVSRLYEKSFEYYLTAPVNMRLLAIGHILAGALRGMYASFLVLIISYLFGISISVNFYFVLICFLSSILFATFGYGAALTIDSHYDMARFNTFIMTPMTFLSGTFFSLNKLPSLVKSFINLLPLTHTTNALRDMVLKGSFNKRSIVILLVYTIVLYVYGVKTSYRDLE